MSIRWDTEFSVGHHELDAQHRHIHELVAALTEAEAGNGSQTADLLLDYIARFLEWHFAAEEAVMKDGAYPRLEEHRAEHQRCMHSLNAFRAEFARYAKVDLSAVAAFLKLWLTRHTHYSDRLYMLYVCPRIQAEVSGAKQHLQVVNERM